MSTKLEISPERGSYSPGERVLGTIVVLEATDARELTITLEYRDWTSDYRSVSRSVPHDTALHAGDLELGASFRFGFTLPADALPNQSGTFGSTSSGPACSDRQARDRYSRLARAERGRANARARLLVSLRSSVAALHQSQCPSPLEPGTSAVRSFAAPVDGRSSQPRARPATSGCRRQRCHHLRRSSGTSCGARAMSPRRSASS